MCSWNNPSLLSTPLSGVQTLQTPLPTSPLYEPAQARRLNANHEIDVGCTDNPEDTLPMHHYPHHCYRL